MCHGTTLALWPLYQLKKIIYYELNLKIVIDRLKPGLDLSIYHTSKARNKNCGTETDILNVLLLILKI